MADLLIGFCIGYGLANLVNRFALYYGRKHGWIKFLKDPDEMREEARRG